jgi:hypothetical protein
MAKVELIMAKWISARWLLLRPFNARIPVSFPFSPLGFTVGMEGGAYKIVSATARL